MLNPTFQQPRVFATGDHCCLKSKKMQVPRVHCSTLRRSVTEPPAADAGIGRNERVSLSLLSLVVCTKERPGHVRKVLSSLFSQSRVPDEVVVVDQSLTEDGRRAVLQDWESRGPRSQVRLNYILDPSISGLAEARNVGYRLTSGEYVAFVDDDIELSPETFKCLEAALDRRPSLVAASGIVTNYKPPGWPARLFNAIFCRGPFADERQRVYCTWQQYEAGELVKTTKICGGCVLWRRSALDAIGAYDSSYRGSSVGEDIEISQRALRLLAGGELALVGGAWIQNHVTGEWRHRSRREEVVIVAFHYLFTKDTEKTLKKRFCYRLHFTGILVMAASTAIRRLSLAPLASVARGLRCIKANYKGCSFLERLSPDSTVVAP